MSRLDSRDYRWFALRVPPKREVAVEAILTRAGMAKPAQGRPVLGMDGIERPRVGPAPDWRPDAANAVRGADALTRAALGASHPKARRGAAAPCPGLARSALAARAEARAVAPVAGYTPPMLDPSGALPFGPARGALDRATVFELGFDPAAGHEAVTERPVRMRRGPSALSGLPAGLRAAAGRYAALVEANRAPGCPPAEVSSGGGRSDGGAVARCGLAEALHRRAVPAIGAGVVLYPRGIAAQAGRPRYVLTVLDLVDQVCVAGRTIDVALAVRGWSRRNVYRNACRAALTGALDRLSRAI